MNWLYLIVAILAEVTATLSLRMASQPRAAKSWIAAAVGGYLIAFTCISLALAGGLGIGVAYGIWAASGVALTALASRALFGEPLTKAMTAGIGLIIGGVLFIELGAGH
ncbi:DMT family transporter [Actinomadura syzygii]|uniref:QacE family quaternary ammonium compound efflux SMR transporter n=1 Tax=Actinomadura syzygii TaxID=1427538 RepID=A0A5D0UC47_9ACTN|nr:SMR family transporter [Actinomadura syzygii]TYC15958.1 QacE family quaternary ammonium compound efflux SMR transporter [Actinomadura syzygii]